MQIHQKIIHLLARLALLKYQSFQGGVKEMYAKEEIEGAMIQGKVSRTVFDHDADLIMKITWQSVTKKSSGPAALLYLQRLRLAGVFFTKSSDSDSDSDSDTYISTGLQKSNIILIIVAFLHTKL